MGADVGQSSGRRAEPGWGGNRRVCGLSAAGQQPLKGHLTHEERTKSTHCCKTPARTSSICLEAEMKREDPRETEGLRVGDSTACRPKHRSAQGVNSSSASETKARPTR